MLPAALWRQCSWIWRTRAAHKSSELSIAPCWGKLHRQHVAYVASRRCRPFCLMSHVGPRDGENKDAFDSRDLFRELTNATPALSPEHASRPCQLLKTSPISHLRAPGNAQLTACVHAYVRSEHCHPASFLSAVVLCIGQGDLGPGRPRFWRQYLLSNPCVRLGKGRKLWVAGLC